MPVHPDLLQNSNNAFDLSSLTSILDEEQLTRERVIGTAQSELSTTRSEINDLIETLKQPQKSTTLDKIQPFLLLAAYIADTRSKNRIVRGQAGTKLRANIASGRERRGQKRERRQQDILQQIEILDAESGLDMQGLNLALEKSKGAVTTAAAKTEVQRAETEDIRKQEQFNLDSQIKTLRIESDKAELIEKKRINDAYALWDTVGGTLQDFYSKHPSAARIIAADQKTTIGTPKEGLREKFEIIRKRLGYSVESVAKGIMEEVPIGGKSITKQEALSMATLWIENQIAAQAAKEVDRPITEEEIKAMLGVGSSTPVPESPDLQILQGGQGGGGFRFPPNPQVGVNTINQL